LQLFTGRNLAAHFVEEVFEEDHLVLCLLSFRCLDLIRYPATICSKWLEQFNPYFAGSRVTRSLTCCSTAARE